MTCIIKLNDQVIRPNDMSESFIGRYFKQLSNTRESDTQVIWSNNLAIRFSSLIIIVLLLMLCVVGIYF